MCCHAYDAYEIHAYDAYEMHAYDAYEMHSNHAYDAYKMHAYGANKLHAYEMHAYDTPMHAYRRYTPMRWLMGYARLMRWLMGDAGKAGIGGPGGVPREIVKEK